MKKLILASIVGAVTLFIWGMISWMALPWHNAVLNTIPEEQAVASHLQSHIPATGVYIFPGFPEGEMDEKAWNDLTERHEKGPIGFLVFTKKGFAPMAPSIMGVGFLINLICAFIAALLLSMAVGKDRSYLQRVGFVALIGVLGAIFTHGNLWNWMHFPSQYTLVNVADMCVAWTLAGLTIGAVVKGEEEEGLAEKAARAAGDTV